LLAAVCSCRFIVVDGIVIVDVVSSFVIVACACVVFLAVASATAYDTILVVLTCVSFASHPLMFQMPSFSIYDKPDPESRHGMLESVANEPKPAQSAGLPLHVCDDLSITAPKCRVLSEDSHGHRRLTSHPRQPKGRSLRGSPRWFRHNLRRRQTLQRMRRTRECRERGDREGGGLRGARRMRRTRRTWRRPRMQSMRRTWRIRRTQRKRRTRRT
jgi:hypothetical protein